jgi:L-methionine (R)-S-oxide reductase
MTEDGKRDAYRRLLDHLEVLDLESPLQGLNAVDRWVQEVHASAPKGLPHFWGCGVYFLDGRASEPRLLHLLSGSSPACSPLEVKVRTGGVCSDCVLLEKPIVVNDVTRYPAHIFCDSRARSEVVVPLFRRDGRFMALIDVDHTSVGSFTPDDVEGLEELAESLAPEVERVLEAKR